MMLEKKAFLNWLFIPLNDNEKKICQTIISQQPSNELLLLSLRMLALTCRISIQEVRTIFNGISSSGKLIQHPIIQQINQSLQVHSFVDPYIDDLSRLS